MDYNTFQSSHVRKARVPHTCGECRLTIHPGQEYEDMRIVYDGSWTHLKTCVSCVSWGHETGVAYEDNSILNYAEAIEEKFGGTEKLNPRDP